MMKWNANNIILFLQIYEKYPILWNIHQEGYRDLALRESTFEKLSEELKAKGLLEDMSLSELRARIKSIKDSFRQELSKIEKSKRSNKGSDVIYKPKLVWFGHAHFLHGVISTGKSKSNLETELTDGEIETDAEEKPYTDSSENISYFQNNENHKLKSVNSKSNGQDSLDAFGKYIVAELRELPAMEAILLQQQIQNLITSAKLSCLNPQSLSIPGSPTSVSEHSYRSSQDLPDPEFIDMTPNDQKRKRTSNISQNKRSH